MENKGPEQVGRDVPDASPKDDQAEVPPAEPSEPVASAVADAVSPPKRKRPRATERVVDETSSAPFWPLIRAAKVRHVFSPGEIVAGRVQRLTPGGIVVDLFGKAQAVADSAEPRRPVLAFGQATSDPPSELSPDAIEEPLLEGDIFRGSIAAISESGHIGLFNRTPDDEGVRKRLQEARESRSPIHGVVYGFNRGGFDVLIDGLRAFCPARGMSLDVIKDPQIYIGHKYDFMVSSSKERHGAMAVTRRPLLEAEALERAKEAISHLTVGQVIRGKVIDVREFGLFVDIGGVQGLAHASELSYDRTKRPQDVAHVGDEVEVKVLEVLEPQRKKERHERVSLSLKALQTDPWQEHGGWLREGVVRRGRVTKLADFGAFVELAPAVEGLLHISEFEATPGKGVPIAVGVEIDVVLERVDRNSRRISLSRITEEEAKTIRAAQEQGVEVVRPRQLRVGSRIEARVVRTTRQGAEIQVVGVAGKKGRGFVPTKEQGTTEGAARDSAWTPGSEIEVKVVRMDRDGTLQCSRKALLSDEEKRAVKDYRKESSKQTLGTLGDLLRQKLGQ